jgi:hypothetical protein
VYALHAQRDWIQVTLSRFGCAPLEFMAGNVTVNICTKCCSAARNKQHFVFFPHFSVFTFSEHRDGMKQKKLANKLHFLSRMHEEVVVLNPNVTGPLL